MPVEAVPIPGHALVRLLRRLLEFLHWFTGLRERNDYPRDFPLLAGLWDEDPLWAQCDDDLRWDLFGAVRNMWFDTNRVDMWFESVRGRLPFVTYAWASATYDVYETGALKREVVETRRQQTDVLLSGVLGWMHERKAGLPLPCVQHIADTLFPQWPTPILRRADVRALAEAHASALSSVGSYEAMHLVCERAWHRKRLPPSMDFCYGCSPVIDVTQWKPDDVPPPLEWEDDHWWEQFHSGVPRPTGLDEMD
jgi:hypothetical protein